MSWRQRRVYSDTLTGRIACILLLSACTPAPVCLSDEEILGALQDYLNARVEEQWKVRDLLSVLGLEVAHTSRAGRVCHVRVDGLLHFNSTLGPRNFMGFGGMEGEQKRFRSEMNFLREDDGWTLHSVKISEK